MKQSVLFIRKTLCTFGILVLHAVASREIKSVQQCAESKTSWMQREKAFGCKNHLDYHCILTSKEELIETCIRKILVKENDIGCPQVHKVNSTNVVFPLKYTGCPPDVEGCPPKNHGSYSTNQLYLYPACFLSIRNRTKKGSSKTRTLDTSTSAENPNKVENEKAHNYTLTVIFIVILLCVLGFCALVVFKRKHSVQECLNCSSTSDSEENTGMLKTRAEYEKQSCLLFSIGKEMLWMQIQNVIREKGISLRQFLEKNETKHRLFHQWQNGLCCKCKTGPEMYRKTFITDVGWSSLYKKVNESCPSEYRPCICQFKAETPKLANVSIATLLSFIYVAGGLTNEGKRSTKALRDCCVTFFQLTEEDTNEEFTLDLKRAILKFAFDSTYTLHNTTKKNIETAAKDSQGLQGSAANVYKVDFDDRRVFEVTELNFHNLPTLEGRTKSFLEKDEFYVPLPRIEDEATNILKHERVLLVTGQMGDGKSSLCRNIMRNSDARIKIKLDSYQVNIDFLRKCSLPCLLYFEDILGVSMFTKCHSKEREHFFRDLEVYRSVSSNVFIMGCIRSGVLSEACKEYQQEHGTALDEAINDSIVDLSTSWKLSTTERYLLLHQFGEKYKSQALSDEDKDKIVQHSDNASYFGFQEICVLCFELGGGPMLFIHPRERIQKEIKFLRDNDRDEFLMMIYILLKNEPLNVQNIDIDFLDRIQGLSVINALTPSMPSYHRREEFKFLRRDSKGAYVFQHQFIKEALLQTYCKQDEEKLLEIADEQLIMECIRPSTYVPKDEYEIFVKMKPSNDKILAKRLVNVYHIRSISLHASSRDERFVSCSLLPEIENSLQSHFCSKDLDKSCKDMISNIIIEASKEENDAFLRCVSKRYSSEDKRKNAFAELFLDAIAETDNNSK